LSPAGLTLPGLLLYSGIIPQKQIKTIIHTFVWNGLPIPLVGLLPAASLQTEQAGLFPTNFTEAHRKNDAHR